MRVAELELDLDVFSGPFDLLLTLVLREEVDLLEVDLADVVLSYLDHLETRGELDLEVATEFLVLIAALLELKSRLMLPRDEDELLDLDPAEAAEELLARMLAARRYRRAGDELTARLAAESGFRYRSAPLPPHLKRAPLEAAEAGYDPARVGGGPGGPRRTSSGRRWRRPRRSTTRRGWGRRSATCFATRRRSTSGTCTSSRRACPSPRGSIICASSCGAARLTSRRRCAAPTA